MVWLVRDVWDCAVEVFADDGHCTGLGDPESWRRLFDEYAHDVIDTNDGALGNKPSIYGKEEGIALVGEIDA